MKRYKKSSAAIILTAFSFLLLFNPDAAGQADVVGTGGRYYEPVEVPGALLTDLTGVPLENIAVFAYRNGTWTVVLSQIDEVADDGSFVLPSGPGSNADKGNSKLDPQDLLVFIARDAGSAAPDPQKPEGAEKVVPVELIDPLSKNVSWAYAASFPAKAPPSKQQPYARLVDAKNYNVRFSSYGYDGLTNTREGESRPTIFINKLWVYPSAGGNNQNIIDRQKIRGGIRFLGGMIDVPINEKIVSGGIIAYKAGPVRIISHSCMYPLFPMGIKGPKFYIDSIMADTLTLTTTIVKVPFDPGSIITDMTLIFQTDLSPAAEGMYYYNSVNREGFLIDGKIEPNELAFKDEKDDWRLITGPQGTQIQYTVFDPRMVAHGKAYSTYDDNESEAHHPENFPGDIGAAADKIVIKSLPEGTYFIKTFGCVPDNFYNPKGLNEKLLEGILNITKDPLMIKASGREIENRGAAQRQVIKLGD